MKKRPGTARDKATAKSDSRPRPLSRSGADQHPSGLAGSLEAPWPPSYEALRVRFWQAGRRVCPDAFATLRDRALEVTRQLWLQWRAHSSQHLNALYQSLGLTQEPFEQESESRARLSFRHQLDPNDEPVAELHSIVRRWAESYRIGADWVIDLALRTLEAWISDETMCRQLDVTPLSPAILLGPEPEPPVLRAYDPTWESASAYRSRAMRELERYMRDQRDRARVAGFVATRRYTPDHVEWTAQHRFLDLTAHEIQTASPRAVTPQAVERAVNRFAAAIGLPQKRPRQTKHR